jgi:hypothetical protein
MQSSVRIFLWWFLGVVVAPGFLAGQAVIATPRITQAICSDAFGLLGCESPFAL